MRCTLPDRPVHRDYWTRFLRCIDILREKKQRTVFRLTLVHGCNCLLGPATEERAPEHEPTAALRPNNHSSNRSGTKSKQVGSTVEGYAALVRRGQPDFIEIKGMTFCGGLDRDTLSMKNVPRHQQVERHAPNSISSAGPEASYHGIERPLRWKQLLIHQVCCLLVGCQVLMFAEALCKALPEGEYAVASEHEHSCCVLLSHIKYVLSMGSEVPGSVIACHHPSVLPPQIYCRFAAKRHMRSCTCIRVWMRKDPMRYLACAGTYEVASGIRG